MKKNYTDKKLTYLSRSFAFMLLIGLHIVSNALPLNAAITKTSKLSIEQQLNQNKITVNLNNVSLTDILKNIQKQTNISFAFDKGIQPESMGKFSLNVKNVSIKEAIRQLFDKTNYTYAIDGESVIITKRVQKKEEKSEVISVKGRVIDSDKKPMPGVMVLVVNTPVGSITDQNGDFLIKATEKDKLEFSFVGFKTEVIPVSKEQKEVLVVLKQDVKELDDVVVVAFGTQKKESVVGSITTVSTRDLKSSSSDLTSQFAGKIAGVIGWQTGGMPGAMTEEEMNTKFYIRGITSFQTGANIDPLILIDGVESSKLDLSRMSTDDIDTFSVMKDASATAMYGARGANGVILVTTKKGREGSVYTSVRYEVVASRPTKEIDVVNPKEYMRMYNRAVTSRNPSLPPVYSVERIDRTGSLNYPDWVYPANDWYDIMFNDFSINHRAGVNIRGGSSRVQYFASINYVRDEGMLKIDRLNEFKANIENNTFTFRTNLNIDLSAGIRLDINAAANIDDNRGPFRDVKEAYYLAFAASPVDYAPMYPADDKYSWPHLRFGWAPGQVTPNPYMELHQGYKDRRRFSSVARAEYIHNLSPILKGLELRASVAFNSVGYYQNAYKTDPFLYAISPGGYDFETGKHRLTALNESVASRTLTKYGKESNSSQTSQISYEARALHVAAWGDHQTSLTAVFNGSEYSYSETKEILDAIPQRNLGLSMRGSYGYKDRYFLEGSFGYNGSERFAEKHRFGFFPAVGGAWVISKERFFAENTSKWLNFLKLRLSWGQVGNDGVIRRPRFAHLPLIESTQEAHPSPSASGGVPRRVIVSYPNDKITWEVAEQSNIGLETKLFGGLLEFNADIYQEIRRNILDYRYVMPATTGLEYLQLANVGTAKSRGIDLSGKIQHAFSSDLWVILSGTFTYNKAVFDEIEESIYKPKWQVKTGKEISQNIGYIDEGLFRDQEEIDNSPIQGGKVMPGDIRYKDINRDGIIDVNDATYIGYPSTPRLIYGFNGFINYKSFEFSFAFQGSGKRSFFMNPMKIGPFVNGKTMLRSIYEDHWSQDNMAERPLWPRLSTDLISEYNPQENWSNNLESRKSTYFMRKASFLRCTSLELAYNIPQSLLKKIKLQNVKIYGRVNNPFLISNFNIWDVELGDDGFNYPIQRTWSIGVNVSF